ncbi:uncharacterized protein K460DRAFT_407592 [Cucurbitaria berberidis CBS 394.84]|uniref:Uncharacterized protein n=1 Tax=Cucurbitaria berberidis CBS 394.84 TaxID=1168544 RepID=A0A9P4L6F0_9PLEO|nr:uncharacterized protein K460DRAFT_407592 [Cucurbitaria berberidis CBS 394.84]KAF1843229.1 hypothetical protein K460DRAFT_407592 [Cucurbitaria berberidis CBS 394.84]
MNGMDESTERLSLPLIGSDEEPSRSQQTVELQLLYDRPDISAVPSTDDASAQMSKEASLPERKRPNVVSRLCTWVHRRLTLVLMLLLPSIALLCAIGHYGFFHSLDKTLTQHRRIRQSHVTTISLVLTTVFKACIVGAVALSFAQHLWRNLREEAHTIGRIEQLFSLRSNPFELTRLRASWEAPLLFSMAIFTWLIPLAVIYPPSALTVSFRAYSTNKDLYVPVLYPLNPSSNLSDDIGPANLRLYNVDRSALDHMSMTYTRPNESLFRPAESILISGKILDFPSPAGENSSYTLEFRGPQLECDEKTIDSDDPEKFTKNHSLTPFTINWVPTKNLTITHLQDLRWYPRSGQPWTGNRTVTYMGTANVLTCKPVSVLYSMDVSYLKGVRQIAYTKHDPYPLRPRTSLRFSNQSKQSSTSLGTPDNSDLVLPNLEAWNNQVKQHLDIWTEWSLMITTLRPLEFSCENDEFLSDSARITLRNGTEVSGIYEARDFNLTEQTMNEYIANVTISALTLKIGKNKTQVNVTEYHTTYDFSAPINLILPYALSLAIGIVFVAIGIWSWSQNGTSAFDGGFLQVMATTVGRTQMEDLAIAHQTSNNGDYKSKELMDLRVRYGELVDAEGVGTGLAAFGTIEETKMLRKGWHSG